MVMVVVVMVLPRVLISPYCRITGRAASLDESGYTVFVVPRPVLPISSTDLSIACFEGDQQCCDRHRGCRALTRECHQLTSTCESQRADIA